MAKVAHVIFKKREQNLTFSRVLLKLAPYSIPLFWIFGTLFNPPNNFAVVKRYGFLSYWFHLYDLSKIMNNIFVFAALLLFGLVLICVSIIISRHFAWVKTNLWITIFYTSACYLSAHALRYVPDTVLDAYISHYTSGLFVSRHFLMPIIAGSLLFCIGIIIASFYARDTIT